MHPEVKALRRKVELQEARLAQLVTEATRRDSEHAAEVARLRAALDDARLNAQGYALSVGIWQGRYDAAMAAIEQARECTVALDRMIESRAAWGS